MSCCSDLAAVGVRHSVLHLPVGRNLVQRIRVPVPCSYWRGRWIREHRLVDLTSKRTWTQRDTATQNETRQSNILGLRVQIPFLSRRDFYLVELPFALLFLAKVNRDLSCSLIRKSENRG